MVARARRLLLLWAGISLFSLPVHAQGLPEELVALRRRLLEDAQREATAGHPVQALELARRAAVIQMSPSVRYFLAQQELTLQRWASAYQQAEHCLEEARASVALSNREAILQSCSTLHATAGAHVGRVLFALPEQTQELSITVDDAEIPSSRWNTPIVVNAGSVLVRARSRGGMQFEQSVQVAPRVDVVVSLRGEESREIRSSNVLREPRRRSSMPVAPWVLMGSGGAASLSALPLWLAREAALQTAATTGNCSPTNDGVAFECDNVAVAREAHSEASLLNTTSQVLLWSGVGIVGGGALWLALAPRSVSTALRPVSVLGGAGLAGSF